MKRSSLPKRLMILSGLIFCGVVVAHAQAVVAQHPIGGGTGNRVVSGAYVARTPYVLHWQADKTDGFTSNAITGLPGKVDVVSVHVIDAESGKVLLNTGWKPLEGEVKVPFAGKHQVRVFTLGKWNARFTEDEASLVLAQKQGTLKDGVIVAAPLDAAAMANQKRIEVVKAGLLKQVQDARDQIGEDGVALLTADIHKAAQFASGEEDFLKRFEVLSKISIEKYTPSRGQGNTAAAKGQ